MDRAARSGKPVVMRHIRTDPAHKEQRADAVRLGYAALAVVPIMAQDKILGVLTVCATEADAFASVEIESLQALANNIMTIVRMFRQQRAMDIGANS